MNFIYPLSRYIKITQVYWSQHLGLDFGWNDGAYCNQPIVAIEDGTVVGCADGYGNTYPNQRIYGNYVNISHGGGWWSMYGHLLKGICVKNGDKVKKGQTIGFMGNSGYSNGQHLHFELRRGANAKANSIDPITYLFVEDRTIFVNPTSKEYDLIRYREISPVIPVPVNSAVDQIEVRLSFLNCRNKPSVKEGERLGFLAEGYYDVKEVTEAEGYTWYRIGIDKWCAGVDGVTFHKGSAYTTYKVLFPYVSQGDMEMLCGVARQSELRIIIEEN